MNTSKTRAINIFADVIAPLGVVGVTIALFLVFMPENAGSLYWFNLVFSSFLEILLFAYIVWLPRREGSVVLKWMFGTFTVAESLLFGYRRTHRDMDFHWRDHSKS